jgi:hypothetical protein
MLTQKSRILPLNPRALLHERSGRHLAQSREGAESRRTPLELPSPPPLCHFAPQRLSPLRLSTSAPLRLEITPSNHVRKTRSDREFH